MLLWQVLCGVRQAVEQVRASMGSLAADEVTNYTQWVVQQVLAVEDAGGQDGEEYGMTGEDGPVVHYPGHATSDHGSELLGPGQDDEHADLNEAMEDKEEMGILKEEEEDDEVETIAARLSRHNIEASMQSGQGPGLLRAPPPHAERKPDRNAERRLAHRHRNKSGAQSPRGQRAAQLSTA